MKEKRQKIKTGKLKKRENMMGYVFVLPWLIGIVGLVLYPLIQSFWYSLNQIRMLPTGKVMSFIQFDNYRRIFVDDPQFILELKSYLTETIIAVPVIVAFSLIISMLLNMDIKGRGFFRLMFFLPVIIASGPVMAQLVDQGAATIPMLNIESIEMALNENLPTFLAEGIASIFRNMITLLWYSGVQILIFLAAIQKIDTSLYEAAKIDGGSAWECFWKITLPTVKPMILLNAVYTIIFLSNSEQNGLIVLIYNTMLSATGGYGYASAMAWCYSIIVSALVALIAVIIIGRKDVYERRAKKYAKELKKQDRLAKKLRKRGERNERRLAKKSEAA